LLEKIVKQKSPGYFKKQEGHIYQRRAPLVYQLKIEEVNNCAGNKEMLDDGVGDVSDNMTYFVYPRNPVRVGKKDNHTSEEPEVLCNTKRTV
jgi:hypothetical protein